MATLVKFEMKKIFGRRIFYMLLAVFAVFAMYNFIGTTFRYTVYDGSLNKLVGLKAIKYDSDLQNQHAGRYSNEETAEIEKRIDDIYENNINKRDAGVNPKMPNKTSLTDEAYFKDVRQYETLWYCAIRQNDFERFIYPTLQSGDLTNLYQSSGVRYFRFHDNWIPAPDKSGPIAARLTSMYKGIEQPLSIAFVKGMDNLINSLVNILLFPTMAILIICLSPIFSEEYGSKTAPIVLTTRHGKGKLIKCKIITSYLFATGLFLICALLYLGFYLSCWGMSGMTASIQSSVYFGISPYNLKVWQLLLAILGVSYLGYLLIASIALFVSAKAKNAYNALILLAAAIYLPLIDLSGVSTMLEKLLLFMPANIVEAAEIFRFPIFYNFGGILIDRAVLIVLVSIAAAIISALIASRAFRNYQVNN